MKFYINIIIGVNRLIIMIIMYNIVLKILFVESKICENQNNLNYYNKSLRKRLRRERKGFFVLFWLILGVPLFM